MKHLSSSILLGLGLFSFLIFYLLPLKEADAPRPYPARSHAGTS